MLIATSNTMENNTCTISLIDMEDNQDFQVYTGKIRKLTTYSKNNLLSKIDEKNLMELKTG